jgi:hypothetical protein
MKHHGWENEHAADRPVPMHNDAAYQATLELATVPTREKEQRELKKAMGFSYRQAIEELVFAHNMPTGHCCPTHQTLPVRLATSARALQSSHSIAVCIYLNATRDGLVYWHTHQHKRCLTLSALLLGSSWYSASKELQIFANETA